MVSAPASFAAATTASGLLGEEAKYLLAGGGLVVGDEYSKRR
jgi:hypothetical protein